MYANINQQVVLLLSQENKMSEELQCFVHATGHHQKYLWLLCQYLSSLPKPPCLLSSRKLRSQNDYVNKLHYFTTLVTALS